MQTEQQTQEGRIVNPRSEEGRLEINGASNKDGWRRRRQQQTVEQREHHSMNFKC